jgi:ubiquinone/menaquinone biosynthesis C-methylase UbiE
VSQLLNTEEAVKRWDAYADTYAKNHGKNGDPHKEVFLNPAFISLMGDINNKDILDAGCGEGYFSRMLAEAGARVTAVDYSARMLEIAQARTLNDLGIEFKQGNCENLYFFKSGSFDLIISNMVIQDLADYQKAFSEMHRLLAVGGSFIFSILHPCFVTPECGWEKAENGEKLHWNVDKYFYEDVYEQALGENEKILLFHRTLTSYINALLQTGFVIEGIVEPKPSPEMLGKYPSFEEDLRCPDFIVFKLRK